MKKDIHAVSVLVPHPKESNRFLALKSDKVAGYSLPCGKLEEGETPEEGAVRECLEETGAQVSIVDFVEPFQMVEKKWGLPVRTYLGKLLDEDGEIETPEGEPVWITRQDFLGEENFYHDYNKNMLEFLLGSQEKVIFLDMDGVMLDQDYLHYATAICIEKKLNSWEHDLMVVDPKRVERLNRIVQETGANIVWSSSWRKTRTFVESIRLFKALGFQGRFLGRTIGHRTGRREHEIARWLEENPEVKKFVIMDDDSDVGHDDHFVKTSWFKEGGMGGLQDEHVEKCIEILGRKREI